jgi:hypothetical protein
MKLKTIFLLEASERFFPEFPRFPSNCIATYLQVSLSSVTSKGKILQPALPILLSTSAPQTSRKFPYLSTLSKLTSMPRQFIISPPSQIEIPSKQQNFHSIANVKLLTRISVFPQFTERKFPQMFRVDIDTNRPRSSFFLFFSFLFSIGSFSYHSRFYLPDSEALGGLSDASCSKINFEPSQLQR